MSKGLQDAGVYGGAEAKRAYNKPTIIPCGDILELTQANIGMHSDAQCTGAISITSAECGGERDDGGKG